MRHASEVHIRCFKSFSDTGSVLLTDGVNLLLGANGAGKSNFISFFRFLNRLCEQQLYLHTGETGGASAYLHKGRPQSNELSASLSVGNNGYSFTLRRTDDDRFLFVNETATWPYGGYSCALAPSGARESELKKSTEPTAKYTYEYLSGIRVFHFHDTSPDAPVMGSEHKDNASGLAGDARNLAPFLLKLRESDPVIYDHICATIRLIAPFFYDFVLLPDKSGRVALRWRQADSIEDTFGPSAFSDGTLRFVCLTALLNQPDEYLPKLILIDEPELGLHPHAIQILAEMLKAAGARTQLVVATQSPFLVDHFTPENVIVVQRRGNASTLERKTTDEFAAWLEEYTLGDLWRKNLLGGTPL
jgi:predicted ATPase